MKYYVYYLLLINVISFIVAVADKYRAIKHKKRIRENDLIALSIVGGSIGMLLGLLVSNHKTRRKKFMVGLPIIIFIQIIILWVML